MTLTMPMKKVKRVKLITNKLHAFFIFKRKNLNKETIFNIHIFTCLFNNKLSLPSQINFKWGMPHMERFHSLSLILIAKPPMGTMFKIKEYFVLSCSQIFSQQICVHQILVTMEVFVWKPVIPIIVNVLKGTRVIIVNLKVRTV